MWYLIDAIDPLIEIFMFGITGWVIVRVVQAIAPEIRKIMESRNK